MEQVNTCYWLIVGQRVYAHQVGIPDRYVFALSGPRHEKMAGAGTRCTAVKVG